MANIYWSYTEAKLISSVYVNGEADDFTWVLRDVVPINLYVVTPQNVTLQPYIIGEMPVGYTFKLSAKPEGSFSGNPYLCGYDFVKSGTGEETVYTCNIRLNNDVLVPHMEGDSSSSMEVDKLELVGELTRVSGEGENCDSTQFTIFIIPDVIRDADVCPTPVEYSSSSSSSPSSVSSSSVSSSSVSSVSSVSSSSESSLSSLSSVSSLSSNP